MRLSWWPALAAPLAIASCTLDFDRYDPGAGAPPDALGGAPSDDGGGALPDASVETEASVDSAPDANAGDDNAADAGLVGEASGDATVDSTTPDETGGDASTEGAADVTAESATVDASDSAAEAAPPEAGPDAGNLTAGLVAYYRFDETNGTTASDSSGNGHTATLVGGASFSAGLQNNAVSLSGTAQYVSLPNGILTGLTALSVSAWVNLTAAPTWSRVFDFGTGTTAYMFLTPSSGTTMRFSVTTGGTTQEQQLNAPALGTRSWQHVVVTLSAGTGTLYVNGTVAALNTSITTTPAALGTTTQNWLGRSEFNGDPYLGGQIDNFRLYSRALSASEVQALYAGHL